MPSSFTSYWGSNIHGVEIKWTCDTAVTPNVLTAEYTSNYYWRMQLYYDGTTGHADLDILNAIGGTNFGTDIKAFIPTAGGTSVLYEAIANRDKFKMQFMIANPDPITAATVPFDGFNGRTWFNVMTGSNDGVTLPSI